MENVKIIKDIQLQYSLINRMEREQNKTSIIGARVTKELKKDVTRCYKKLRMRSEGELVRLAVRQFIDNVDSKYGYAEYNL